MMTKKIYVILIWLYLLPNVVFSFSFIRDAEIEDLLKDLTLPLVKAAGLNDKIFQFYIIHDKSINAFATSGQHIFLNSGLIQKTKDPTELMGVIAHELGHVAGGHVSRIEGEIKNAYGITAIGAIAGIAAAVLTGHPGALTSGLAAGMSVAERRFMGFSRIQESSADQAALQFLEKAQISPKGLLSFFRVLKNQSALSQNFRDPYLLTHPLAEGRMNMVQNAVKKSIYSNTPLAPHLINSHLCIRTKLDAFILSPARLLRLYKNQSERDLLVRSVAFFRKHQTDKALETINTLLLKNENPYYYDLKGQILFESGKVKESLIAYQKASKLKPNQPLIALGMAKAMIALNQQEMNQKAQAILIHITQKEPLNEEAWHLLSIAYGRANMIGEACYALAERNLLTQNFKEALFHIHRAEKNLSPQSKLRYKLYDLKREVQNAQKK